MRRARQMAEAWHWVNAMRALPGFTPRVNEHAAGSFFHVERAADSFDRLWKPVVHRKGPLGDHWRPGEFNRIIRAE